MPARVGHDLRELRAYARALGDDAICEASVAAPRGETQFAHSVATEVILPRVALTRDGARFRHRGRWGSTRLARVLEALLLVGRPEGQEGRNDTGNLECFNIRAVVEVEQGLIAKVGRIVSKCLLGYQVGLGIGKGV